MSVSNIKTKSARAELPARHEPYWIEVDRGFHLGYRKAKNGGTWYARKYNGRTYTKRRLGLADDNQPADGIVVLDHKQARQKADQYGEVLEQFEMPTHPAMYTVRHAMKDYLEWFKASRKAYGPTKQSAEALILPKLGNIPLPTITSDHIKNWLQQMATTPPYSKKGHPKLPYAKKIKTGVLNRSGNPKYRYIPTPFEEWNAEMKRKRKSTANRVLTILKAALNHAWRNEKTTDAGAWQRVIPFKGADTAKVQHLSEQQSRDLVEAASNDFRPMATAALLTGCRYGELCRLEVQHLHDGQLFIAQSKTGKPRHVPLSPEGLSFFKALAKGKARDEFLLKHIDGSPWGQSHQVRPMREACAKAGIVPAISFHVLRHTYATLLLRSAESHGVSIRYVAALIGDSVATCEKHYGHVIQDDLQAEVARKLPSFGGAS